MAELADALDSGSNLLADALDSGSNRGNSVEVQVLLSAPEKAHCESNELFQLNPPLQVGEILLRKVKYACGA